MTPNQGQDSAAGAGGGEDVLEEVHQLEEHLQNGFVEDDRLSDGVPDDQRTNDLDFIQMSGLARPDVEPEPAVSPASEPDVDLSRPVSFFERGVADVDPEMVPGTGVASSSEDEERVSTVEPEGPAADIVDIIAQLDVEDETPEVPESEAAAELAPESPVLPVSEEPPSEPALEDIEEPPSEPALEDIEEPPSEPALEGIEELAKLAEDSSESAEEADGPTEELALDEIEEILVSLEAEPPPEPQDSELDVLEPEPSNDTIEEETALPESAEVAAPSEIEPPAETGEAIVEMPADAGTLVSNASLLEAERLVEELERQPREIDLDSPPPVEEEAAVTGEIAPPLALVPDDETLDDEDLEDPDDVVYDRPLARRGGRRRAKGLYTGSHRRVVRVVLLVAAVLLVIAGGYVTREWTRPYWELPDGRLRDAEALVTKGEFEQASEEYTRFAEEYPTHGERPNAQFLAANLLRAVQPDSVRKAKRVNEQALVAFRTFVQENQGKAEDAKLARAEVMTGMLHFELGEYQETLTILGEQDLRLRDPGAKLPILRTLAETHDRLGDHQTALKLYGEAAIDADNASQDRDYESLARLYQKMSSQTTDVPERRRYHGLALEHWRKAQDVAGLSTSRTKEIRIKISLLEGRFGGTKAPTGSPSGSAQAETQPAESP